MTKKDIPPIEELSGSDILAHANSVQTNTFSNAQEKLNQIVIDSASLGPEEVKKRLTKINKESFQNRKVKGTNLMSENNSSPTETSIFKHWFVWLLIVVMITLVAILAYTNLGSSSSRNTQNGGDSNLQVLLEKLDVIDLKQFKFKNEQFWTCLVATNNVQNMELLKIKLIKSNSVEQITLGTKYRDGQNLIQEIYYPQAQKQEPKVLKSIVLVEQKQSDSTSS